MKLSNAEYKVFVDNLKYGYGNILCKNNNYVVTKPLHTWDTNYKLYDLKESVIYFIDCDDVQSNVDDLEKFGGILLQDLVNLEIDDIKEAAWKTEKDEMEGIYD